MLTGCYPPRIGCGEFDGLPVLFPGSRLGLSPDEVTIAGVLSAAGYTTRHVGKWHCGDQPAFLPTRHGFDGWFGIPYSNDMGRQRWYEDLPPLAEIMADRGRSLPVAEMPPLPLLLDEDVLEAQPDQASLTARFVDESVRFIRAHRDRPWFLYLAHIYVHVPIYVQEGFARAPQRHVRAAVATIDWAAARGGARAPRPRPGHHRGVHERQRVAGGEGRQQRPAAGDQGDHVGGRDAGALHRLVAGPRPGRRDVLGRCDVHGPVPDAGGPGRGRGPRRPDRRRTGHPVAAARSRHRLAPRGLPLLLGQQPRGGAVGPVEAAPGQARQVVEELYDLEADVGETTNRHAEQPEVVAAAGPRRAGSKRRPARHHRPPPRPPARSTIR